MIIISTIIIIIVIIMFLCGVFVDLGRSDLFWNAKDITIFDLLSDGDGGKGF